MSIVLLILQILGIVLVSIIGILILLVLFVLFAPFTYCIEGDIHETKWAKARAAWLLHLIRARISYEDDLIYGEVGILWKKITFSHELTKDEEANEQESSKEKEEEENKEVSKEKKKEPFVEKIKGIVSKIKELYPKIKRVLTDERNKQAVTHLKDELIYFIKILLPKKSRLHAAFSTGSPDTTGQLCGIIACFPLMYQKDWALRPDFTAEEAFFEGDFWGKGRFNAFQIVGILLRIIFDKNCRRMYTMINKLFKKSKPNQEDK